MHIHAAAEARLSSALLGKTNMLPKTATEADLSPSQRLSMDSHRTPTKRIDYASTSANRSCWMAAFRTAIFSPFAFQMQKWLCHTVLSRFAVH